MAAQAGVRAPRRGRPRKIRDEVPPDGAAEAAASDQPQALADFAVRLKVGQACEAGCGTAARWGAAAERFQRFGCAQHIGDLLDPQLVWFLHAVG